MAKRPRRDPLKCNGCGALRELESVTCRVYRKRSQVDYRYRICADCRQVLEGFLEGAAESIQRGLYLEPQG